MKDFRKLQVWEKAHQLALTLSTERPQVTDSPLNEADVQWLNS